MRRVLTSLLLLLCAALCGTVARAHPMPESRAWLDTTAAGARLTLQLPLNRLEFAFGQPLADKPGQVLPQHADALARYLLQHVGARSAAGGWQAGWQVLRPQLQVHGDDGSAELQAVLELRAPPGADARRFTLLLDAVTHEVRTHRIQVFLRQDWAGGQAGAAPLHLGDLDTAHTSLPVSLPAASDSAGASLAALFKLGAAHIAEGTDHLLFLLALLIVAPLQAQGRRWGQARAPGSALKRVAGVVTAFTAGHSLTLALGSTGVLRIDAQVVEVGVALSIIVAALHAWRPLLRRGELLMAAGFGLLHGLAFAAGLYGAGLSTAQHAQALLAFNLGIEALQLLVVLVALPPLLMLLQTTPAGYARLRKLAAAVTAVAATGWLMQRLRPQDPWSALPGAWVDSAAAAAWPAAAVLWLLALALVWWRRRQQA